MFKMLGRSFMFFACALRSWLDELFLLEVLCGSLEVLGLLLITFLIDSLEVFTFFRGKIYPDCRGQPNVTLYLISFI